MALLWISGGASRGDALGQVVIRAVACLVCIAVLLGGVRPDFRAVRPVLFVFLAIFLIPLVQLMPMPPDWWQGISDREPSPIADRSSVWQPLTMVPGATLNSLFSLTVPAAIIALFMNTKPSDHQRLLQILFVFIVVSALLGLVQYSGTVLNNPLINDVPGSVSSIFANRNHFALLMAMGCILTPVWAFDDWEALRWRGPVAAALVIFFILMTIATGSRAGLLLAPLGLVLSFALVGNQVRRHMRRSKPWVLPVLTLATVFIIVGFITLSFFANRIEAIDRLFALSVTDDLRIRAGSTMQTIIWSNWPWGAGLGAFDAAFRADEPIGLLGVQYFNQAHNEYLGIALEAGLPGTLILLIALVWWLSATVTTIRAPFCKSVMLARLGSALLLLIFVASVTDYPTRTPIFMAIAALSGAWLAYGSRQAGRLALPKTVSDV